MDVRNLNGNNEKDLPENFYDIVSKILAFIDEVDLIKKNNNEKKGEWIWLLITIRQQHLQIML